MTSSDAAREAVRDLLHQSSMLAILRNLRRQDAEPWDSETPTQVAAQVMEFIVNRLFETLTQWEVEQAVIHLSNDNRSGCLLVLTNAELRVVGRVLWDGTIDMRFYRCGRFEYGEVLWRDGLRSEYLEEPGELL